MTFSSWLLPLLLWSSPGAASSSLASPTAQDDSPGEAEWNELRSSMIKKMIDFREMNPVQRKTVSFQAELAQLGNFIRKYSRDEPDVAFAARIFMARSLLSHTLEKHNEALQLLQTVVMEAEDPWVAGMAAVNHAEIVIQTARSEGLVRVVREIYEGRKEHAPQFVEVLKSMEVQASLRPGVEFPDLGFQDLQGKAGKISDHRGKVVYVVFFNVVHDASRERLEAAVPVARTYQERPVQVLGFSLDSAPEGDEGLDLAAGRAEVQAALKKSKVEFPVAYDGLGWESPVAERIGLRAIPATFLLDSQGRILERDLPPAEVASFIQLALDEGRGEDGGPRSP